MAHALRYFCSWQSERYKHQMRLELWEKDYKGEATAMVLSGEPQLTMEEGDTICGSSLDFGLLSETNGQYLHLYTTDNHKYLIKILRDGAVMWEGYLLPEYYSEAYIAAPYTVSFTATDWLGMLKNVDFPAEDTRVPILQIIKTCLQYTELPLDFACQMDMRVEGINDTTNILGALYLNPITFTGYNCYEVLEKILASFNATLRQIGHRWLISSIDDDVPLRLISWNSLSYTGNGESNNGELIGTNFDGTFIDGSLAMVISPAKQSVDLSQDIFYRESWLKDYDFLKADSWEIERNTSESNYDLILPGTYKSVDGLEESVIDYIILPQGSYGPNGARLFSISQSLSIEGIPNDDEFTLGIKYLTPHWKESTLNIPILKVYVSIVSETGETAWLSPKGWVNTESYIELLTTSDTPKYKSLKDYKPGRYKRKILDKTDWPTTKINFISLPYSGTLNIKLENIPSTTEFDNDIHIGGVYLTKTNITKNISLIASLNPDAAETASSVNLMLCDSPEERNVELGVLNYFSLSDGALTTGKKWYYNGQEYEDFLHAMAYSYSRCYANKRQKLSGALYTDKIYNLCSFTDKWSGKRHIIKSWNYSIISERLDSMEIIETPAKEIELTLSTPEAGSSNKQNQPSGGTSGGGSTSMAGSGRYVNLDTAQEVSGEKTWNDNANFKKNIVVEGDGIFGGEVSGIVGEGTPAGVTDYSALTGKPEINGVTLLSGNNTLVSLGIQPAGDYITESIVNTKLDNYATKTFVANNYAGKAAFNAHTADTYIHITEAERTAWNSKWDYNEETIKAVKVTSALSADSVAWSGIGNKPTTITGYGITDAYTSSTIDSKLSGYLPLSGGTIEAYNASPLTIKVHTASNLLTFITANNTERTVVGYYASSTRGSEFRNATSGSYIGITDEGTPHYNGNTLIHAGNYNSYSPTLTGTGASGTWGISISGNAATATKLQTPRTIWGQRFDGTKDITGYPSFPSILSINRNPNTGVILDSSKLGLEIETYASDVRLKTYIASGRVNAAHLVLTSSGNVLIGTTTDNGYKLDVNGKGHYSDDLIVGGEVVAVVGEGTPAGVTDYSALTGKPQINGVTLVSGNNTLASLGIQAAGDYATNSGVTTLLADYAKKTFVANNYAGKAAFNNHTADTDIHITSAERKAWNAKWNYDEATIKAVKVTSASSADSVAWSGISGKPSTFTPSAHTHTASDVSGLPTSLKNPYALTFGSKTYDGSAAATITASDLGALTAHQSIYALTLQVNSVSQGTYNPTSAAKTINIAVPTKTSEITNDSGFITSAAIPTALKNPYAVEIKANGVSLGTYDGSKAATFNLSAANVGAANKVHSHTASEISGLPTKLSVFTNDVGYITGITKSMVEGVLTGNITSHTHSYLPLSGGTIEAYNASPLTIKVHTASNLLTFITANNTERTVVGYYASSTRGSEFRNATSSSYIGITDEGTPHYNGNTLIHAGNYNSYSPTLTGTGASGTWGISISGNAATATKLQTPRTIWGQPFDGNGDVNGVLSITTTDEPNFGIGPEINFHLGGRGQLAMIKAVYESVDWSSINPAAGSMRFYTAENTSPTEKMRICPNGNVLIGTTTDSGYKLQVGGSERVYGDLIVDGEVSALVA